MADRSRVAATHRRATSLFGESEVPLISRKAARSRVEVEIIDDELDMIWLTEVDEGEDHGNEEGLDALCDIRADECNRPDMGHARAIAFIRAFSKTQPSFIETEKTHDDVVVAGVDLSGAICPGAKARVALTRF